MTNLESFNNAINALKSESDKLAFMNYFIGIISAFESEKNWKRSITKALQLVERFAKPAVRP